MSFGETLTDTKYLINGSTLSAIGDAIRAKEGTTETYSPATMAQKITDDLVKPSGTLQIKSAQQVDVRSYQYAKVTDDNLAAENIKKDVTILGVTGTHEGASAPSLQSKSVTYTANGTATITPDEGYDGMSSVDVTVDVSGGGGGGYSTIDEIMQANGYTTQSENITGDQILGFKAMLDDAVAQIEMESAYSTNHEIVPYFNDAESKIAFVIQ